MESFGNERRVQQGEDWNLDLLLSGSNKEYIPFIIPMAMQHPYFVCSIGSTKYEKNYRYVKSWWNEYKGPKFTSTVPIYYGEIIPTFPETIDLGTHDLPPTAFNYRNYHDQNPYDYSLGNRSNNPEAFTFTPHLMPGLESDQVKVGYPGTEGIDYFVDKADDAKLYNVNILNSDTQEYDAYIVRVLSYRGMYLQIATTLGAVEGKIVEIGYDTGVLGVNFFVDTENNSHVYKYKLTGDNTVYYCRFNYKTLQLEDVYPIYVNLPEEPSTIRTDPTYGDNGTNNHNLYYYTVSTDEVDPDTGHKPYHYFYFVYNNETVQRVDIYNCTITFNFTTLETGEWNGQNYMYQITLVTGQLMADYLQAQYDLRVSQGYDMSDYPTEITDNPQKTNEVRYNYFKTRWPDTFSSDIDSDSPLGTIENLIPIMPPTKLEVFNNVRRLI